MDQIASTPTPNLGRKPEIHLRPIDLNTARQQITAIAEHASAAKNQPCTIAPDLPHGSLFALCAVDSFETMLATAVIGRPLEPEFEDPYTAQLTWRFVAGGRVESLLFAAAWRSVLAMGFRRILYFLPEQASCVALIAAGYYRLQGPHTQIVCEKSGQRFLAWGRGQWDLPSSYLDNVSTN